MPVPSESTLVQPLLALDRALTGAWDDRIRAAAAWATEPVAEAESLVDALPGFAFAHGLSALDLRMLVAVAVGDGDPRTLDGFRSDEAVIAEMVARVRRVAAGLRALPVRTRIARQDALRLALHAATATQQDGSGASTIKAHAERVREELARLPRRVAAVRKQLKRLFLARPMTARVPTARLSAVA